MTDVEDSNRLVNSAEEEEDDKEIGCCDKGSFCASQRTAFVIMTWFGIASCVFQLVGSASVVSGYIIWTTSSTNYQWMFAGIYAIAQLIAFAVLVRKNASAGRMNDGKLVIAYRYKSYLVYSMLMALFSIVIYGTSQGFVIHASNISEFESGQCSGLTTAACIEYTALCAADVVGRLIVIAFGLHACILSEVHFV